MRLQPLENPRYVEVAKNGPKMRDEGPIVLMMLEACFWGSKIKVIFGCVFEASPGGTEGFGHEILAQSLQGKRSVDRAAPL